MAKTRRVRAQRPRTRTTASLEPRESPVTSARLTNLLIKIAPSAPVIVQSGLARRASRFFGPPIGWSGWAGSMPAPPPGSQVLWVTFSVDWQIYTWKSWGPANNSDRVRRVDFGVSWRWRITPNPYYVPEPLPEFIGDSGRHEFYTSVVPGGSGFDAAWIAPARSKTLTPDSKESDPTPLQLLLSAERNGVIPLWFGLNFSNLLIDGHEAHGYTIWGGAEDFYWSYAYTMARRPGAGAIAEPVAFES